MESIFMNPNVFSPALWGNYQTVFKNATDGYRQFETLGTKITEKLLQRNTAFFNNALQTSNQVFAMYGEGKAFPEVLNEQVKVATDFAGQVFSYWRETGELFTAAGEEYRKWLEASMKPFEPTTKPVVKGK